MKKEKPSGFAEGFVSILVKITRNYASTSLSAGKAHAAHLLGDAGSDGVCCFQVHWFVFLFFCKIKKPFGNC
jgi:hypothetical protein